MANFLYLPAHKNIAMFGTASATVDADYQDDWLNDGRPGRPARGTSGSLSATITTASTGNVSIVAISHHNLTVNVTLGGGLSGTITASATQQNGVPLNVYTTFGVVSSVSSFTIAASNPVDWVVGEVFAGEYTSLTLPLYTSDQVTENDYARQVEMDLSSIPGYPTGLKGRSWEATWPALSTSELDGLIAAMDAQYERTRPTLVVRRTSVNDAKVGFITSISHGPSEAPNKVEVSMTFVEIPRVRWPA